MNQVRFTTVSLSGKGNSHPQQKVSSEGIKEASAQRLDLLARPRACMDRWPK